MNPKLMFLLLFTCTVLACDTLSSIALRHGVTVRALRQTNHLKDDRIVTGQRLQLPAKAAVPNSPDHGNSAAARSFKPMATTPVPADDSSEDYDDPTALRAMDVLSIQILLMSKGFCPGAMGCQNEPRHCQWHH